MDATERAVETWGRLPEICLVIALGVLLVAVADTAARYGQAWAPTLFWAGIVAMFAPVGIRLSLVAPSRREALGLVIALGTGLYLARVVHSPLGLTSYDELIHLRTAGDILRTGHLYTPNPILPVSAVYPGIELVVTALVNLTGLSTFAAALIVVGAARIVLVASLFLTLCLVSRSSRIAAIATVLFTASSTFFYFDAQFAYESLALPLGLFLVYLTMHVRRNGVGRAGRLGVGLLVALTALALAVTHHATAFAFAVLIGAWVLARFRRASADEPRPGWTAVLLAGAAIAWALIVGRIVFGYLGDGPLGTALHHIPGIGSGITLPRRPFEAQNGSGANVNEQLLGFLGTGLTMLGLLVALPFYWRNPPRRSLGIVLGVLALLYPASLAFRFIPGGWELANRASGFLFLGVAFVLALGLTRVRLPGVRDPRPLRAVLLASFMLIVPLSGIVLGTDRVGRLPGPYRVGAGTTSVEPRGIAAAEWARSHLGPGNRLAADRTNATLMASFGGQRIVNDLSDHVAVGNLFLGPTVAGYQRRTLRAGKIRYLVVDRRIGNAVTPPDGFFYEPWELDQVAGAYSGTKGVNPQALTKYDKVPGVDRVFDDGSIVVYDVGALDGRG